MLISSVKFCRLPIVWEKISRYVCTMSELGSKKRTGINEFYKKSSGAVITELVQAYKELSGISDLPEMTQAQLAMIRYHLRREILREKITFLSKLLTEL